MNNLITGICLIVFGLLGLLPFFRLSQIFEYPDILRQPTGNVIRKYHDGGTGLTLAWFAFAMAFVVYIPAVIFIDRSISAFGVDLPYLRLATVFGVIGAVFNILGLMRWVFLVPLLANKYVEPNTGQAIRDTIEVVFEAFHTYLGVTVGEFLGYLFVAVWGILVGFAIIQSGLFAPIVGWLAIVFSIGVLVGELEFAGWKPAGVVAAVSATLFLLWAIGVGVLYII